MHSECARFDMDDGYVVGLRDMIFTVMAEFAEGVGRDTRCQVVPEKCNGHRLRGRRYGKG